MSLGSKDPFFVFVCRLSSTMAPAHHHACQQRSGTVVHNVLHFSHQVARNSLRCTVIIMLRLVLSSLALLLVGTWQSSAYEMAAVSDAEGNVGRSESSLPSLPSLLSSIPTITIGNDVHGHAVVLPLLGAGTWQYNDTIAYQSVCHAFDAGYTFVDTAFGYGNQKGVGRGIQDCWASSRQNLFVMTKIPGGLNSSQVHAAHKQNLMELQLDYVDHLMTHFPADWDAKVASKQARQEEWLALEEIYKSGEARSIGISHYCTQHILDILEVATILPSINQVEYHVGSQDVDKVRDTCREFGITFMSFSPLCGPCELESKDDSLIHGGLVTEIATHYEGVEPSQVSLRYIVQQNIPVIPKSNTPTHIVSNRDIFQFSLSQEHMATLSAATKPAAEAGDCDVP
jgi:diketogulonate reductase-like aldo/keto reductase